MIHAFDGFLSTDSGVCVCACACVCVGTCACVCSYPLKWVVQVLIVETTHDDKYCNEVVLLTRYHTTLYMHGAILSPMLVMTMLRAISIQYHSTTGRLKLLHNYTISYLTHCWIKWAACWWLKVQIYFKTNSVTNGISVPYHQAHWKGCGCICLFIQLIHECGFSKVHYGRGLCRWVESHCMKWLSTHTNIKQD